MTADGGKTWRSVGSLSGIWGRLLFRSRTEGFARIEVDDGTTQLVHTIDGGSSWTTIFP
jgi:hypothetical protein